MHDGGLVAHRVVEGGEEGDRVGDDLLRADGLAVHEPPGELEFGVQARALGDLRVGGSMRGARIRVEDVVARGGRRGRPAQVDRRVADAEPAPGEEPRHLRDAVRVVLEDERGRVDTAEHDGRLEAPERVGADGGAPAAEQSEGQETRGLGGVEQTLGVGAHLLCGQHRQAGIADDGHRQVVHLRGGGRERRRDAAAGGHVRRVDTVAGQQRLHERQAAVDAGLAEHVGSTEGQHAAHARGQRAQRARLGAEVGVGRVVHRHAHDDPPPVVELGDRAVVTARGPFAQRADAGHHDAGQGRGHRRG